MHSLFLLIAAVVVCLIAAVSWHRARHRTPSAPWPDTTARGQPSSGAPRYGASGGSAAPWPDPSNVKPDRPQDAT